MFKTINVKFMDENKKSQHLAPFPYLVDDSKMGGSTQKSNPD